MPADWENFDSPQVKLMHEWSQGFEKKDLALIAKCLHKDYRHTYYPRSLGKPEATREQWLEHLTGVVKLWTDHEVSCVNCCSSPPPLAKPLPQLIIHSITDAPGKVVVHVRIPDVQINIAPT